MKLRYLAGYSLPLLSLYRRAQLLSQNGRAGSVRVLVFHNIPEDKIKLFRDQIHNLASHYQFLTPHRFHKFVEDRYPVSGTSILITFDDGFRSNRVAAEEVLKPLGIKGIFFVPTRFIGLLDKKEQGEFVSHRIYNGRLANSSILSKMKPLRWEDLEYLLEQGNAIGSHTITHSRLSIIPQDGLYDEIIESGNILEERLGVPIIHFAYPFGDIDSISSNAMDLIKKRYKYCFSGVRGANHSLAPYTIFRDEIDINYPPRYVRFVVENGLDLLYRKKAERFKRLSD